MNFNNLNTYNDSANRAFEALCNQLFERWLRIEYKGQIEYFTTVNGAGGDGGVEAYSILKNGDIIGIQAKWFRTSLQDDQISQIRSSIKMARKVRSGIKRYIVCLPRDFQSLKIGKGKKLIENTEEKRINDLIEEIDSDYPDLDLEFWNEDRIRQELQNPGNEGIARFWFEREELSQDALLTRFLLAKSGWLRERYIPDLHAMGVIHSIFEKLIYSSQYRTQLIQDIKNAIGKLQSKIDEITEFNKLAGSTTSFHEDLLTFQNYLLTQLETLRTYTQFIKKGIDGAINSPTTPIQIEPLITSIVESKLINTLKNVQPRLISALEEIADWNIIKAVTELGKELDPHNAVIIGKPGTGKTHGVAREVEIRLNGHFPALIIQAKTTPCSSWSEILRHTTGGLNNWSDIEIFSGLEALAVRKDLCRATEKDPSMPVENEPTRVLICIDGIDESLDISSWRTRIDETHHLINSYPRLRFIFTSRSYPPYNENPCDLHFDEVNRKHQLPTKGDYPIDKLVPIYLEEYKIYYENVPWILNAFESAFSLKLFCETYKGQDLSNLSKTLTISVTSLIKAKFDRLEIEFIDRFQPAWSATDQIFNKILHIIAEAFQIHDPIEHDEFSDFLVYELKGLLDRKLASHLLDVFIDHGILLKNVVLGDDLLSPSTIHYSLTFQAYYDYFIAIKAATNIGKSGSKSLPDFVNDKTDKNTLLTIAIILLNDYNILIGENDYWVDDLQPNILFQLKYQVLNTASDSVLNQYTNLIREEFLLSTEKRNFILSNLILPNLYRAEVQLAVECVHNLLINFANTYERDIAWSGPAKYNNGDQKNIGHILSQIHLKPTDQYDALPLIFAWSLSGVNNTYREYCRAELTKWALHNIDGFIKLLDLLFHCGDPQIQEDLSCIMLGLASLLDKPQKGIAQLAEWVSINIFQDDKIIQIKNVVVRFGARSVITRAKFLSECTEANYKASKPPYKTDGGLLNLDFSGEVQHDGGRSPIVHDLAWYVINKSFNGFLDYDHGSGKSLTEGDQLLKLYEDKYESSIGAYGFAMSAAIAYIKQLGWNAQSPPGMTEATHGGKSKLATFEEKYTWLAVHEIKGYLADLLPYKDYNQTYYRIQDYNLIIDVLNPAEGLSIDITDTVDATDATKVISDDWYVPVNLSPVLEFQKNTIQQDVESWVNRKEQPDFKKWINTANLPFLDTNKASSEWVSLYMYTELLDPTEMGTTILEIVCGLLPEEHFDSCMDEMIDTLTRVKKSFLFSTFTHLDSSLFSHPQSDVYTSVRSNLWMKDAKEDSSVIDLDDLIGYPAEIIKTVAKATENSVEGEKSYKFPSKFIRELIGITTGNQTQFLNDARELLAFSNVKKNDLDEHQEFVVVDEEYLKNALIEKQVKPFWIAFQYQSTSLGFKNKFKNISAQNCRFWLVWQENDQLKSHLFHDGYFKE